MSDPTGGRTREQQEEDSLKAEAYGKKGAAVRKTMGKMAEGAEAADSASHGFINNLLKHFK